MNETILTFYEKNRDKFSNIEEADLEILKNAPFKAYSQLKKLSGGLPVAMIYILETLLILKKSQQKLKQMYDKYLGDIDSSENKEKARKRRYARKKVVREKYYEAIEICESLDNSINTEKLKAEADEILNTNPIFNADTMLDTPKDIIGKKGFAVFISAIYLKSKEVSPPYTTTNKVCGQIADLLTSLEFVNTRGTPYTRNTIRTVVFKT